MDDIFLTSIRFSQFPHAFRRAYYALMLWYVLYSVNFTMGITFIYYQLYQLSYTDIFTVSVAGVGSIVVAQLLSGVIADLIGYRNTLFVGMAFLVAGGALIAFAPSFVNFIMSNVFIQIASAFVSNSWKPLLRQMLDQHELEIFFQKYYAILSAIGLYMSTLTIIGGGLLLLVNIHIDYYINFAISILMLAAVCFIPRLYPSKPLQRAVQRKESLFKSVYRYVLSDPRVMTFVVMAGGLGFLSQTNINFSQAYFLHTHMPLILFGVMGGLRTLFSGLGANMVSFIPKRVSYVLVYLVMTLIFLVVLLFAALFQNIYVSILIILSCIATGVMTVLNTSLIFELVPMQVSATANSLVTVVTRGISVCFLIEAGMLIDIGYMNVSYYLTMLIGGGITLLAMGLHVWARQRYAFAHGE